MYSKQYVQAATANVAHKRLGISVALQKPNDTAMCDEDQEKGAEGEVRGTKGEEADGEGEICGTQGEEADGAPDETSADEGQSESSKASTHRSIGRPT